MSDVFKGKVDLIKNLAFTPWGQLVTFGNKLLLIDYEHNQLLHFSEEKENQIRPVLFQYPTDSLYYCADSVLYFGNILENRLQSLALHRNDFVVSGDAVYTSVKPVMVVISLGALFIFIFAGWMLWRRNKKAKVVSPSFIQPEKGKEAEPETKTIQEEESVLLTARNDVSFTDKEKRIIQLIADNTRKNMGTSTEAINKLLGLLKTNPDNQKSQRSKLFTSVNKKYSNWKHTNEELIQNRSQQDDGRYKEYYIAVDKLDELKAILAEAVQSH